MAERKRKLPELSPRGQQVLAHVLTAVALGSHDDAGDLESIAHELGLTPRGLRPTLKKMEAAGYITVEGSAEYVYPTPAAVLEQNPRLSPKAAAAIVRGLKRGPAKS